MNNSSASSGTGPWQVDLSLAEFIIWASACILVALAATVGNILVIGAFWRAVNLQSRLHYFVVGLSAADIMVGCVSIPMWVYILYLTWRKRHMAFSLGRAYETMDVFAAVNSILHLMAVSTERLYATLRPHSWNQRSYSKRIYFGFLLIIWTLSAIIASLFALPSEGATPNVRFHLMNTFFFLPLGVICMTYVAIWCDFKRRMHGRTGHDRSTKLTFTLFIVIGLFVVTWLPFFVVRFVLQECAMFCISWRFFYFTKFLHFSNSGLNPIVYGFRIPEYRSFMLHFIGFRRTPSEVTNHVTAAVMRQRSVSDATQAGKRYSENVTVAV
ncbi:dopamine D2-like receptor [Nematostella vectensis]|uniref:dopamine D2-like receptor n=1 Tax=Nematostella vectensis TaxID=45351 RepID=UPI0013903A0D|nr:dopamine D2-like receptor [Nematostella vectensis]XP_032231348.1 dopamine D2-like receptor [Nematostella vectensis]XP_032231349.1 dopamine D2-like receptor [Nematostella vectensis]